MIPTLDQARVLNLRRCVLGVASAILRPKLARMLNPSIDHCYTVLKLHFANGDLKEHYHVEDQIPGYAYFLNEIDNSHDRKIVLCQSLRVINAEMEGKVGQGGHGSICLKIEARCGEAEISCNPEWVCRLPDNWKAIYGSAA